MEWNWNKLPESEHLTLIAHVEAERWSEVAKLCEQHEISVWCCCNAQGLRAWAKWAIEIGIINGDGTGSQVADAASGDGGTVIE